ncbi:flagellar biosynthesis repressor FlbT [Methylobacterium crusticola]|uniref:flagellar biosynthesis repressor FlbT n=1 Tax=Methylobacterium crusticola TaxID=1697972 RepID=UPI000FFC05EF|nr:flagellar biosynthesis repressor FlbT [Methylobacterium crusticola]
MPLRLNIKPFETIYINGAVISNGDRSTDLVLHNHCRMLRESEMISEAEANTPCKRIVLLLQQIHLKENPFEELNELSRQSIDLLVAMPDVGPHLLAIQQALSEKKTHIALKKGKALVAHEAQQS